MHTLIIALDPSTQWLPMRTAAPTSRIAALVIWASARLIWIETSVPIYDALHAIGREPCQARWLDY